MNYQLVLQFPASSIADYDAMIAMEESLRRGLGNVGRVDGHDAGSGEMNIFIFTDHPKLCFEAIQQILGNRQLIGDMKAAFRKNDQEDYTILHPLGLTHFRIA